MIKGYAVMEIGWQYNDETYEHSGDGVGTPVVVYKTREKAEAAAKSMNEAKLKSSSDMCDVDEKPITDFYEVVVTEMED